MIYSLHYNTCVFVQNISFSTFLIAVTLVYFFFMVWFAAPSAARISTSYAMIESKQVRQCMYIILRRVCATTVAVERQ
jgi:hypothetical protein